MDVLEVMIDDALFDPRRMDEWRALSRKWPLVAHGVALGIGDACGLDAGYVAKISDSLRAIGAWWYSEHLCFLRATAQGAARKDAVDLGHFAPMVLDDDDLAVLSHNAAQVRRCWAGAFLLENPADILGAQGRGPTAGRESGVRFARALEAANAGALLDLTNLVLQGRNDGFEPGSFLEAVPWERVVEVHLAGGRRAGALWVDSHDHPVDEEAWTLLSVVARRAENLRAVIIERDDRLPPLDALLAEVDRAREVLSR